MNDERDIELDTARATIERQRKILMAAGLDSARGAGMIEAMLARQQPQNYDAQAQAQYQAMQQQPQPPIEDDADA